MEGQEKRLFRYWPFIRCNWTYHLRPSLHLSAGTRRDILFQEAFVITSLLIYLHSLHQLPPDGPSMNLFRSVGRGGITDILQFVHDFFRISEILYQILKVLGQRFKKEITNFSFCHYHLSWYHVIFRKCSRHVTGQ
ncbi:unnamed protein product [Nesidiocoris tenuis]|uniref:Uncharacterized protein n=1 Tax=Nesidiocoris tenuis TaxID=355587 RepID=A0A6H5GJW4_9HEMI|nr:unnamed protein product [Nesidiocoris tenuis]